MVNTKLAEAIEAAKIVVAEADFVGNETPEGYRVQFPNGTEAMIKADNNDGYMITGQPPAKFALRIEEILEAPAEPAQPQNKPPTAQPPATRKPAAAPAKSQPAQPAGNVMDSYREQQARTYKPGGAKGKEAPTAFAVSEEANRRQYSTQVIDAGRTTDCAWALVRAIDPTTGQFREAKVTFEYNHFRRQTAWDLATNMEEKAPGMVTGYDPETELPILASRTYNGIPAALYLIKQIMHKWGFADRDAESKAERRAIMKLSNREWRESEEIASEKAEEAAVRGLRS